MSSQSQILQVATGGAGWMLLTSIAKKIINFGLKQILIRQSTPELMGAADIQLELLLSTLLFLSRESIRGALIRIDASDKKQFQYLINLSYIPGFILLVVTFIICFGFQEYTWSSTISPIVIQCYCLGALFEAFGEPFHNAFRNDLNVAPGANADTVAIFLGSLTTVICTSRYFDMGIYGYGLAQMIHGFADLVVFIYYASSTPIHGEIKTLSAFIPSYIWSINAVTHVSTASNESTSLEGVCSKQQNKSGNEKACALKNRETVSLAPRGDINASSTCNSVSDMSIYDKLNKWVDINFNMKIVTFATSSFSTSILKHILTQADKIMLTLTATNYNQGIYAVTHNYASLVARIVFWPIEESSRLAFSKLRIPDNRTYDCDSPHLAKGNNEKKRSSNQKNLVLMKELLMNRILFMLLLGSIFVLFGTCYVRVMVYIIMAPQWRTSETVNTFVAFCYYIAVLGLNGISEAFVHSVASAETFRSVINTNLVFSSLAFAVVTYICNNLYDMGTIGVIIGNICAMFIRMGYSFYFIRTYFNDHEIKLIEYNSIYSILVQLCSICMLLFGIVYASDVQYMNTSMLMKDTIKHIGIGLLSFLVYIGSLVYIIGYSNIKAMIHSK